MRVVVDTNGCYTTRAGTARYIRGLLDGLQQVSPSGLEITPLAWEVENLQYEQPYRALKTAWRELMWAPFIAPRALRQLNADLFHATAGFQIRSPKGMPRVETLLDCAILRNPDRYRNWQRWTGPRRLQQFRYADRVICISRFTADEAIRFLGVPAQKIEVVYLGSSFDTAVSGLAETPPPFELPAEFFLFVGSLEPGKNLALLREAYLLADAGQKPLPPLVIVGSRWKGVASEGRPPTNWIFADWLPDSTVLYCYRRALALVFPSSYEGFGLPVLEAMSAGCPVICSPIASIPEVGGEAAMYSDLDAASYLASMREILGDNQLRRTLIAAGLHQSRKFSWKQCASQTVDVYRSVLRAQ